MFKGVSLKGVWLFLHDTTLVAVMPITAFCIRALSCIIAILIHYPFFQQPVMTGDIL